MAFPTTLALITALWSGPGRTKSIALWSGLGGAIAALGPLLSGALLEWFWWGSVFLITLPLAAVALVMAIRLVPAHVNETTEQVDNLGGVVSVVFVASLYADQITAAAKTSFLEGDQWAYLTGIVAVLAGAAIIFLGFPKHEEEERLLVAYHAEDTR